MKKTAIIFILTIVVGCYDQPETQKPELTGSALIHVLGGNVDYWRLVNGLSQRNEEFLVNFRALSPEKKKQLRTVASMYDVRTHPSLPIPESDLRQFLGLTTTSAAASYILLLSRLERDYRIDRSEISSIASQTTPTFATVTKEGRTEVMAPCAETCQINANTLYLIQLNRYYAATQNIEYSDEQATLRANLWLSGCLCGCTGGNCIL